jgi:hypothetical protein
MGNQSTTHHLAGSGVTSLQAALIKARAGRSRPEIADLAQKIAGSDQDFSPEDIARHEHTIRTPPADGLKLRTHVAAVGMTLPDALALIGYWPELGASPTAGALAALKAVCARYGLKIAAHDPGVGRVVIQL